MKILAIISTLDLKFDYGCTLQWWQFLKGFYEEDVELVVTPYLGEAVEGPWWRVYKNPCQRKGDLYLKAKRLFDRINSSRTEILEETAKDRLILQLTRIFIQPKWRRHIDFILSKESDIDIVIVFGLPLNQIITLPTYIKSKYQLPVMYYDGDVPASLPRFGGFASGFRRYNGADLSEYDVFISNSKGGVQELKEMGAKNVDYVYWGADPDLFAPLAVEQDIDVFFYGFGYEYRKEWIEHMISSPSRLLAQARFVIRGNGFDSGIDIGRAELRGDVPFNLLRNYACRSKINLNITRHAHASLYGSSSARIFELAAMGCCIISNPCSGIEEWFEPGKEIFVVHNENETMDIYRNLLSNRKLRLEIGNLARDRVLREHTYRHRARNLLKIIERTIKK